MLRGASRLETSYRVGGALRAVSGAVVNVARRVATAFSPRASRDARVKCRPPAVGGDRKSLAPGGWANHVFAVHVLLTRRYFYLIFIHFTV